MSWRTLDFRLVIEKEGTNTKYYPGIENASISYSFPFACPTATLQVLSINNAVDAVYSNMVNPDDIVRIQVNEKYSSTEANVYEDLFEGRVVSVSADFNGSNLTTLECRGHAEEMLYRMVTADYSDTTVKTGAILASLTGSYLSRITDDSPSQIDSTNSTSITSYNVQQDTKFVSDVLHELEGFEDYGYRFDVDTSYDADDNLSAVYAVWDAVPSTANAVQIIEGSPWVKQATFKKSIDRVVNDVTVYGASGTPQKVGTATDATSQTNYNTRHHVSTDTSITSDSQCGDMAVAIKNRYKDALTTGTINLAGTNRFSVGDLVHCEFPSIYLAGAEIDADYRIYKVSHNISSSGWMTTLQVGEIDTLIGEYISSLFVLERKNNLSFVD